MNVPSKTASRSIDATLDAIAELQGELMDGEVVYCSAAPGYSDVDHLGEPHI